MFVRNGRSSDLRFVLAMMRTESNAVGFIPATRIEWGLANGRVAIAVAGREPIGYIYAGSTASGVMPIFQAVTERGARRREIGAAMLAAMESLATSRGCWGVEARVRDDLESNAFWGAMAYGIEATVPGGSGRGRQINVYSRRIWLNGRGDVDKLSPTAVLL